MGKLAGAAVTAVAPEAKAATAAAGKLAGGRGRAPVPDPRVTRPGSEAARQRQAVEDVKAARPAPPPTSSGDGADPVQGSPPASPSSAPAGVSLPSLPGMGSAAQTSSGFVLGLFLWGWVALPYLRGGAPEVRRTLAAKFLNKSGGTGGGAVPAGAAAPAPLTGLPAAAAAAGPVTQAVNAPNSLINQLAGMNLAGLQNYHP